VPPVSGAAGVDAAGAVRDPTAHHRLRRSRRNPAETAG
jgi:hypothetical protein